MAQQRRCSDTAVTLLHSVVYLDDMRALVDTFTPCHGACFDALLTMCRSRDAPEVSIPNRQCCRRDDYPRILPLDNAHDRFPAAQIRHHRNPTPQSRDRIPAVQG